MRIAVAVTGQALPWASRLRSGLPGHDVVIEEVTARRVGRSSRSGARMGRRDRRRCLDAYEELLRSLTPAPVPGGVAGGVARAAVAVQSAEPPAEPSERFRDALYGLADAAAAAGGLGPVLRPAEAVAVVESVRDQDGPGGRNLQDAYHAAQLLGSCLRPLEQSGRVLDGELASVDVWHAVGGGRTVLPGLLAHRAFGTPLLVTEFESALRGAVDAASGLRRGARRLPLALLRMLAREAYRSAGAITAGSAFTRRWLEHCGADPGRVRVLPEGLPGVDRPAAGPEPAVPTLAWQGTLLPGSGLEVLLRAFSQVRSVLPEAVLRVHALRRDERYVARCLELARGLGLMTGDRPEDGFDLPGALRRPDAVALLAGEVGPADAGGSVLVLPEPDRPAPHELAAAMATGRAVVATDVGMSRELLGPAGLLVPPNEPEALAAACTALLGDPERRARLGLAGRLRVQERCAEQTAVEAFGDIYLDLISRAPGFPGVGRASDGPRPFAQPVEFWLVGKGPAGAGTVHAELVDVTARTSPGGERG
jgi:glycosyltransferase involved in cell wall biosynthesis